MKPGDFVEIKAIVLRVEGTRLDAQTPNGQLIQTDVSNIAEKSVENKAVESSPENKRSKSK